MSSNAGGPQMSLVYAMGMPLCSFLLTYWGLSAITDVAALDSVSLMTMAFVTSLLAHCFVTVLCPRVAFE
jgi:hypothetical protein